MDATYSWVGTPGYIPQEGPGQSAADIFSLGKVIYEISTGNDRHDFPLLPANATGLRYLNEVLLRACARLAEDRHKSADELAVDLERVAEGRPPLSRERKKRRRIMALVAAVGLGGLAWSVYERLQPNLERGLVLEMALPGELKLTGPVPVEDHRGEQGTALFFDGSDDRAEMPLPETLGPDATLAVWVKSLLRETSGCIAGVFGESDGTGAPTGIWLEARDHGKLALRQRLPGDEVQMPEAVSDIALKGDGTWHLLMGVSEGGRLRLYVDGRLQQSTVAATPLAVSDGTVRLGHDGAAAVFRGGIGRFWVFNRALNETEARLLFERQGQMDPLRGLVAHYPLNGNGEDVSGQNRPLKLEGCQPDVDRHGLANCALAFDGAENWAGTMSSGVPTGRAPRTLALWAWRDANQTAARAGVVMTGYAGTRTKFGLDFLQTNQVLRARPGLEAPFPAGQWVHLATTYDGVRTRLYVDGRFTGQVTERLNTVHARLYLGVNALVRGATHFHGALDELRIYNRALTAKEVAGLVQLEQTVPRAKTPSKAQPQLLFPNSDFSRGTLEGWRVVYNMQSNQDLDARADGSKYVKILKDIKADGGYLAEAKAWEKGVTLLSLPIKVNPGNRILLARYCKPFGVSSCSLVVFTSGKPQQLLEKNHAPNLVVRRHDLKPWLGQTIRVGFSGGQMRIDYLKTQPGR